MLQVELFSHQIPYAQKNGQLQIYFLIIVYYEQSLF